VEIESGVGTREERIREIGGGGGEARGRMSGGDEKREVGQNKGGGRGSKS